jgi:DNA-dependent protein kinase catalytic subunit
MKDLQLRILRLLGRQAQYNKLILDQRSARSDDKTAVSDLIAWDPESRVKFKIPFQEMKTELQLGKNLSSGLSGTIKIMFRQCLLTML